MYEGSSSTSSSLTVDCLIGVETKNVLSFQFYVHPSLLWNPHHPSQQKCCELLCLFDSSVTGLTSVKFTSLEETEVLPFSSATSRPCILSSLSNINCRVSNVEDFSVEAVFVALEAGVEEGGSSDPSTESFKLISFLSLQFLPLF